MFVGLVLIALANTISTLTGMVVDERPHWLSLTDGLLAPGCYMVVSGFVKIRMAYLRSTGRVPTPPHQT